MGRSFAISTPTNAVDLAGKTAGEVTMTVTNRSGRPLRGTARLCPIEPTRPEWIKIVDGDAERAFEKEGTHQYKVSIEVPADTAPGKYAFRLDFVSSENPDEDSTAGPAVTVKVEKSNPTPSPFPWWILIVVGAVLLVGLGIGGWLLFRDKGEDVAEVDVPDVISKTVDEAQKILLEAGLTGVSGDPKPSDTAKPGTVVDQEPKKGEKLARGKEVKIFPVKEAAAELVDIPADLVGKDTDAAKLALFEKGLAPKLGTPKFTGKKPGTILQTIPAAGQKVPKGSAVELIAEKQSIAVPSVVRMDVVNAAQELNRRGLDAEFIQEVNTAIAAHTVIRQDPASGFLEPDSKVKLWIAKEPGGKVPPMKLDPALFRAHTLQSLSMVVAVKPNRLTDVQLVTASPAALASGGQVQVKINYATEHKNRAYVMVKPKAGGKVVGTTPSVICDVSGSGQATLSFTVYPSAVTTVDTLDFELVGPDKTVLASVSQKVQYQFSPVIRKEVIRGFRSLPR